MKNIKEENKYRFLFRNLFRGLLILGVFVLVYILFNKFGGADYFEWLEPVYSNHILVYLIYSISEIFFGIIPPEVFMAWGLKHGGDYSYITIVSILTLISYAAGWVNFLIGLTFRQFIAIRWFIRKYLKKYVIYLHRFGGFLIIVAAVTPIPYAAVCLLVGTVNYDKRKFFLYTLFRVARFIVYAYIVWKANEI